MADRPMDDGPRGDCPAEMSGRVAALEALTQQTLAVLHDLRADACDIRAELREMGAELREMRADLLDLRVDSRGLRTDLIDEIRDLRHHVDAGLADLRQTHDRDFPMAIGLSLGIAVGLAGSIARGVYWP